MARAFFGKVGADFSRVWIATWYVSALSCCLASGSLLAQLVKAWIREGRLNRRAVIVGGGPEAEELIKALEASPIPTFALPASLTTGDRSRLANGRRLPEARQYR